MGEKNEVTDSFPASTQPQMDIHHKKMLCVQLLSRVRQAVGADVLADSENRARCARSAGAYGAAADLAKVAESLGVLAVGELPQLCLARQSQQLASLATRVATSLATPTATSATSTSAVAAGVSPQMYAQGAHTAVETFSSNCSVRHDDHRSEHNEGPLPDPMISGVSCPIGITLARDALEEMIRLPLMVAPHLLRGIRTPPCSLMLHGPPGTGKTSLVKYMAAAFELPLFSIRPGDVLSKWSGAAEKTLKAIFEAAKEMSPSCIFIDECDSLCIGRGGAAAADTISRSLTTTLLLLLSSITDVASPSVA